MTSLLQILQEVSIDQLRQQWVDTKKLDAETFDKVVAASKGSSNWATWLTKRVAEKQINPEDIDLWKDLIPVFERYKSRFQQKDINQVKTSSQVADFRHEITQVKDSVGEKEKQQAQSKQDKLKAAEHADGYIGEVQAATATFRAYKITKEDGHYLARKLGSGTSWCTASENSTWFNRYIKDGPLYVFISEKNPKIKYQIHGPSEQCMDARDSSAFDEEDVEFFYNYLKKHEGIKLPAKLEEEKSRRDLRRDIREGKIKANPVKYLQVQSPNFKIYVFKPVRDKASIYEEYATAVSLGEDSDIGRPTRPTLGLENADYILDYITDPASTSHNEYTLVYIRGKINTSLVGRETQASLFKKYEYFLYGPALERLSPEEKKELNTDIQQYNAKTQFKVSVPTQFRVEAGEFDNMPDYTAYRKETKGIFSVYTIPTTNIKAVHQVYDTDSEDYYLNNSYIATKQISLIRDNRKGVLIRYISNDSRVFFRRNNGTLDNVGSNLYTSYSLEERKDLYALWRKIHDSDDIPMALEVSIVSPEKIEACRKAGIGMFREIYQFKTEEERTYALRFDLDRPFPLVAKDDHKNAWGFRSDFMNVNGSFYINNQTDLKRLHSKFGVSILTCLDDIMKIYDTYFNGEKPPFLQKFWETARGLRPKNTAKRVPDLIRQLEDADVPEKTIDISKIRHKTVEGWEEDWQKWGPNIRASSPDIAEDVEYLLKVVPGSTAKVGLFVNSGAWNCVIKAFDKEGHGVFTWRRIGSGGYVGWEHKRYRNLNLHEGKNLTLENIIGKVNSVLTEGMQFYQYKAMIKLSYSGDPGLNLGAEKLAEMVRAVPGVTRVSTASLDKDHHTAIFNTRIISQKTPKECLLAFKHNILERFGIAIKKVEVGVGTIEKKNFIK